jgi:molybdopterin-guanine dinucleotide biosynthesis protein A
MLDTARSSLQPAAFNQVILMPTPPTVCVLLAGGSPRRLGGGDKLMRQLPDLPGRVGQSDSPEWLWAVNLRQDLRHALVVEGVRMVESWAARHGVARAEWSTEPFSPFFNVNTPEDLAEAEALVRRHGA